ncbi:MAG TPA: hypothetical protein VND80_07010 [Steroidobacteraceae bacterium]|nr:hypothetical protein [Steroidobacteraceae bacterium]
MRAAVEISMYPLGDAYIAHILAFIERLNRRGEFVVVTNDLSTQIWGDLGRIMTVLGEEIARATVDSPQLVFVMKVLPGIAAPSKAAPA